MLKHHKVTLNDDNVGNIRQATLSIISHAFSTYPDPSEISAYLKKEQGRLNNEMDTPEVRSNKKIWAMRYIIAETLNQICVKLNSKDTIKR